MYDSFTAYEEDFRAWCQAEYPGPRPETHDRLPHILDRPAAFTDEPPKPSDAPPFCARGP